MKRAASPCLQRGEPRRVCLSEGKVKRRLRFFFGKPLSEKCRPRQPFVASSSPIPRLACLFSFFLRPAWPRAKNNHLLKFASMLYDKIFNTKPPAPWREPNKDTPNHIPTSTSLQAGLRLRPAGWTWDPQSDGSPETLHATLNTEEPQVPPRPPLQPDLRLPVSRRHPSHLAKPQRSRRHALRHEATRLHRSPRKRVKSRLLPGFCTAVDQGAYTGSTHSCYRATRRLHTERRGGSDRGHARDCLC